MKIEMIKDFSFNGTQLEKGKVLEVKKGFLQKGDIDKSVADTLVERCVAEVEKDEPKSKSANNKPSKK